MSLHFTMGSTPLPLKIAPSYGRSGPPSNRPTWFLGPTRALNPNGISIGEAVFAELTSVTDRQTTLYSVGNNRPHIRKLT